MNYYVIAAIVILLLVYRWYLPKIKGRVGESRVAGQLAWLNRQEYKVINDLLLVNGNRSSQIDHVVVSRYGIFVIETKNYKGWIHGGEHSEYWTQTLYRSKYQFRNPIKQNWSHVYALKDVLPEYNLISYYPIVVFAGSANLKNVYSSIPVVYSGQLKRTIVSYSGYTCLSAEDVNSIANKLHGLNRTDKNAKRNHVRHARYQKHNPNQYKKSLRCPSCGASLVVRKGQYGTFYGCSNYPRCRHTSPY